jgi:hypothetical protein
MAKSQSELSLPGAFLLVNARHHSHCHCEEPKATKQSQGIRGGEEENAWPGQKNHCVSSLREAQRRSNPFTQGSLKWGRLKNWVY